MARRIALFASLCLAACSSDHGNDVPGDAGSDGSLTAADTGASTACGDPALAAQRAQCAFKAGDLPALTLGPCSPSAIPIEHVVVLMQENRSFDQYFGHLRGHGQDDVDVASDSATNPGGADGGAPIAWHHDSAYCEEDTDHGWVASHRQWNNGANDGFAISNVTDKDPSGQRALGWYDQTDLPFYYDLASTFAISDRYFCSVLGPTYPNRLFLYAGTAFGRVNTDLNSFAPPGSPNLFDSLTQKGVSWKVYRSDLPGAALVLNSFDNPNFLPTAQFAADAAAGALPQVAFVDPSFLPDEGTETDEHPPADIQLGQQFVWQQVTALIKSPQWSSSALFITYDEHGGLFDHVPPPPACAPDATPPEQHPELGGYDRLGFRVPLIVVSPWVKRHFVSHDTHSHTSILRFIELKFDLPALTSRDANSDALLDLFDFAAAPRLDVPDFAEPTIDQTKLAACKASFPSSPGAAAEL